MQREPRNPVCGDLVGEIVNAKVRNFTNINSGNLNPVGKKVSKGTD